MMGEDWITLKGDSEEFKIKRNISRCHSRILRK